MKIDEDGINISCTGSSIGCAILVVGLTAVIIYFFK